MPPRDKDGNYTEFEPKIMVRDPGTGDTFEFQATALDDGITPRRGPDDGLILPGDGQVVEYIESDGSQYIDTGVRPSIALDYTRPATTTLRIDTRRSVFPRMSRQRFIKLLMSHGYPRNYARAWAEAARHDQIPYNTAYFLLRIQEGLIPC